MPVGFHSILCILPAAAVSSKVMADLASLALKQRKPRLMAGHSNASLPAIHGDFEITVKRYHRSRSCFLESFFLQ